MRDGEAARAADATPNTSLLERSAVAALRPQHLHREDATPYAVLALDADQSSAKPARNVVQGQRGQAYASSIVGSASGTAA